ncbi:MAG: pur operon repressor [Armatimonadota bacterium]|nr:pur operon repressor [Armatimonadota bacterium]MDR7438786.1 pur operon repressor [Armatimonadota bacterium]
MARGSESREVMGTVRGGTTGSPRLRRGERMLYIAHLLRAEPYKVYSLNVFMQLLGVAKSTVSEDVAALRVAFQRFGLGRIETLAGAAGGVRYVPERDPRRIRVVAEELSAKLSTPHRLLPGGFLYTTDLLSTPSIVEQVGEAFATYFGDRRPDVVLTMEVKGIPVAFMTARAFNVPLVTIRRAGRVTEGPAVTVNYLSGSSRMVQQMSLPLRAIREGQRVLFVDDFLRGGGTVRGMYDLMREFRAEVVGVGVFIASREPREKLVEDYFALLVFEGTDERGGPVVRPSDAVLALPA